MPTATKSRKPTAADLLSELPANVHFCLSRDIQRDRILEMFGQLMGQEAAGSAADRVQTDEFIAAVRGQQLDPKTTRLEVQKLIEKFHFHQDHSPHSEKALAAAEHEHEQAAKALREAQERLDQAQAAYNAAKRIDDEVQAAEHAIATKCLVMGTALQTYLDLKA